MIDHPVSFFNPVLGEVVQMMDANLRSALRRSMSGETQPFSVAAKVTFSPVDGGFDMQYEVGHQFEPIKIKGKGRASDRLYVGSDDRGLPVFLHDAGGGQVRLDNLMEDIAHDQDA